MDISELSNIANDLAVLRLEIQALNEQKQKLLASIPELVELERLIGVKEVEKDLASSHLMDSMKAASLRSWKTNEANFAITRKYRVQIDPNYQRHVLASLKAGEDMPHFTLIETDYMAIRSSNPTA